MTYLECDNYTVILWHRIDCSSINRHVCLYLVEIGAIERRYH